MPNTPNTLDATSVPAKRVAERCRQILWKLSSFQKADDIPSDACPALGENETLLGRYLHRDCTIVFWLTDQALYLPRAYGVPKRRLLADIKTVLRDEEALLLIDGDGGADRIIISGGNYRHLFEIIRFFEGISVPLLGAISRSGRVRKSPS